MKSVVAPPHTDYLGRALHSIVMVVVKPKVTSIARTEPSTKRGLYYVRAIAPGQLVIKNCLEPMSL